MKWVVGNCTLLSDSKNHQPGPARLHCYRLLPSILQVTVAITHPASIAFSLGKILRVKEWLLAAGGF
jgi:hypothetical protein